MSNSQLVTMKNNFRMDLANEGYELRKLLSQNDVLDKNVLQNCLNTMDDHLKILCLKYACEARKSVITSSKRIAAPDSEDIWATIGGTLAGGALGVFLSSVTVKMVTTGMLWWKTTVAVSLAETIATAIGVPVTIATGGIALALGLVGGYAVSQLTKSTFKGKLIDEVMEKYEKEVVPKLLEWFDREISDSRTLEWN